MLRGNHREALFATPADRQALNEIVAHVLSRIGGRIHAFCWMTNHLHALVQINELPLGRLMQRIAVRFSRYRHRALHTSGHLFERRYKAKLVDVDEYFLTLLRYIHLNPVKARLVADPADYPWSSHRAYLGRERLPWLTTDLGLSLFSNDLNRARLAYQKFISDPHDDDDLESEHHPEDARVLGGDRFINNLPFIPYKPRSPLSLDQLAERVCEEHGITSATLRSVSRTRHLTPARIRFATQAVDLRIATLAEVARFLHRDPSALTKLLARHKTALSTQR
jgi:putative transposase